MMNMNEFLSILLKSASIAALAIATWMIVSTVKEESQRKQLAFRTETFVRFAAQTMKNCSGADKKKRVTAWVKAKALELHLPFSDDDIDKCIEAVYNTMQDTANGIPNKEVVT